MRDNGGKMKSVIVLLLVAFSLSGYAMSLQDMTSEVIKTNPTANEQVKNYNSLYQEFRKAKGGYLPKLDIYGSTGHEWVNNSNSNWENTNSEFYQGRVVLRQDIFNGFSVSNDVKKQVAKVFSSQFQYYGTVNRLCFDSVQQYLDALKAQSELEESNDILKRQQAYIDIIKERVASGIDNGYDVERANAKIANLEADNIMKQNDYNNAIINVQKLLGRFVDGEQMVRPSFDTASLPVSQQDAMNVMSDRNPLLISAEYDVEYQKYFYEESKKGYYPEIYAELSHDVSSDMSGIDGTERDTRLSLNLHYNLFNGTKDKHEVQKNLSLIHKYNEAKDRIFRDLSNDLELTWSAHRLLAKQVVMLQKNRNALQKVLKAYKSEFKIGKRKLVDIMDLEEEIYNLNTRIISTNYELLTYKYKLLYTVGTLPDALGVKPVIENTSERKPQEMLDTLPVSEDADKDKVKDTKDFCQNSKGDTTATGCDEKSTKEHLQDVFEEPKPEVVTNVIHTSAELKAARMQKNTLEHFDMQFFANNSTEMTPAAIDMMRELVSQIKDISTSGSVEIYVYSSDMGNDKDNYILSSKRAYNMFRIMLKNNVNISSVIAYGKKYPDGQNMPANYVDIYVKDPDSSSDSVYDIYSSSALSFRGADSAKSSDAGYLDNIGKESVKHFATLTKTEGSAVKVDVVNFSYDKKDPVSNKKISDERAAVVANELRGLGLDADTTSFGIDHELNEDDITTADSKSPKNRTYIIVHQ